jgi:hypothetical protein
MKYILATILLAMCAGAMAGPALVQMAQQDRRHPVVRPVHPGFGWELASGPYKDSRCEKPALVK